jgi:hypothetical protein
VQPKPTKALQLQIANDNNNNNKNVTTKTCSHKTCEVYRQQTQPPPPQKPTKLIYRTYSKQQKCHKALEANFAGCKNQRNCWYGKQNTPKHLQHILEHKSNLLVGDNTGH